MFSLIWTVFASPVGCIHDEDRSLPPVVTIKALQNTTVEQFNTVKINCAALHIGINTTIQWTLNGSLLQTSSNVAFITANYSNETCRAASQIVITNFTTEDVGVYTCFINRSGVSYSDNISLHLNPLLSSKIKAFL